MNTKFFCVFFNVLCLAVLVGCSAHEDASKPQKNSAVAKNKVAKKAKPGSVEKTPTELDAASSKDKEAKDILADLSNLLNGKEAPDVASPEKFDEQSGPEKSNDEKPVPEKKDDEAEPSAEETKVAEEVRMEVAADLPPPEEKNEPNHLLLSTPKVVDKVEIGNEESEREHNLQGENMSSGTGFGGNWRHADQGKWFSYEMKVLADRPMQLVCTYWGGDGEGGGLERTFDILIDGDHIATQRLKGEHPERFFEVAYPIPDGLTARREKVVVKFQAHQNAHAGGLYGCRMAPHSASPDMPDQ